MFKPRKAVSAMLYALCSLLIGVLAYAATANWPFTTAGDYTLSDSATIEVTGGKLQLKAQKPFHLHDTKTEFDTGTYSDTEFLNAGGSSATQTAIKTTDAGLVSWWKLDGGTSGSIANGVTAGLTDSKSTNNGTANNANATGMAWTTGQFSGAVSFDGTDDFINVLDNANLNPGANVSTLTLWLKTSTANKAILSKGTVGTNGYTLKLDASGYPVFVKEGVTGGSLSATSSVADNNWHHVAALTDAGGMYLYIDGVQNSTNTNTGNFVAQTAALTIGKSSAASSNFSGAIDDIAIYNTGLTANQIQAQAAAGARVHMKDLGNYPLYNNIPNLVSYYKLDEGTGQTVADGKGTNNGTLGATSGVAADDPAWTTSGKLSNALTFDGSDDVVKIPAVAALNTGKLTLAVWVKPTSSSNLKQIIGRMGVAYNEISLKTSAAPDNFCFVVNGNSICYGTSSIGAWNHVAGTYDGVIRKLYVNGVLVGSGILSVSIGGGNYPLEIGGSTLNSGNNVPAVIDEAVYYNRALTYEEIRKIYYGSNLRKFGQSGTYTGPVMDGEIATAAWDTFTSSLGKAAPGMQFHANILTFVSLVNPFSGTAADMDNDGDMDIVAGNIPASGDIQWYQNDGQGNFAGPTNVSTTIGASDITLEDLTGDKARDILVADGGNGGVKWFKSDGAATPTFTVQTTVDTSASPSTVAAADIDNDGDLDIVAGFSGASNKILWYQSSGGASPTFTAQPAIVTSFNYPNMLVAKDINNDGFIDIVSNEYAANTIAWFKGNGGSSWTRTNVTTTFTTARNVDVADMDADGDLDILGANYTGNKLTWFVNDGSATPAFSTANNITTTFNSALAVRAVDFDNDGDMDVVAAAGDTTDEIAWWKNDGSQNFTKVSIDVGFNEAPDLDLADFDGDGTMDILAPERFDAESPIVFFNTPFKQITIDGAIDGVKEVWPADIDADGDIDIAIAADGATVDKIGYYKQTSPGVFGAITNSQTCGAASDIAVGDVNNDAKLDMVAFCSDGLRRWTQGANADTWTKDASAVDASTTGRLVIVALDGGRSDILMAGNNKVDWYKQNETTAGQFDAQTDIASFNGAIDVEAVDIDGDGDLDVLACALTTGNEVAWWAQTSPGVFGTKNSIATAAQFSSVAAGDLDGDGDVDVVGYNYGNAKFTYWLQTSPGVFGSGVDLATGFSAIVYSIDLSDMDGDGDLDILAPEYVNNSYTYFFENLGGLVFSKGHIGKRMQQAETTAAADIDGDGLQDVVVAVNSVNNQNQLIWFQQNPASRVRFQIRTDTTASPVTSYVGPDNTAKTFFSTGAGIVSNLDSKRYGQYKAFFHRNDTTLDPQVKNVRLDYTSTTYSTLNPSGINNTAQSFTYLTSFTETATKPAGSAIKYQISADGGAAWKYYNAGWVASDGTYTQSTDAATVNTNIATFDNALNLSADGNFKFKALLNSDGTALPQLDTLDVGYESASITLTLPNGTEVWKAGSNKSIAWSKVGVVPNDLIVEYTTDGNLCPSCSYTEIANSVSSISPFAWNNLPNVDDPNIRIRIRSASAPAINDASNADFAISNMAISAPNGTEVWKAGQNHAVTWTAGTNAPTDLVLEYSIDAPHAVWTGVSPALTGTDITNRSYTWNTPVGAISSTVQFRIRSTGNVDYVDPSNADFTIADIAVTAPNGSASQAFNIGASTNITWTASANAPTDVVIEYSIDAPHTTWTAVSPAPSAAEITAKSYPWTIPAGTVSSTVQVRVRSTGSSEIVDRSDVNFRIYDLKITAPNTAVTWPAGSSQSITWTQNGLEGTTVKLELWNGGSFNSTIATVVAKTALSAPWNPVTSLLTTTARVRVIDETNGNILDESDVDFTISGSLLTVTNPLTNDIVAVDTTKRVNWNIDGAIPGSATIRLAWSNDGLANNNGAKVWNDIPLVSATNTPGGGCDVGAEGCYDWVAPSAAGGDTVVLRIKDEQSGGGNWSTIGGSDAVDGYSGVFKVKGSFTIIEPGGGEKFAAGAAHTIQWSSTGLTAGTAIKLYFATDADSYATWYEIDSGTAKTNTGTYSWTPSCADASQAVPTCAAASNMKVRIEKSDDTSVKKDSLVFSVTAVTVTAPNTGVRAKAGTAYNVTWAQKALSNVKIEHSYDGGNAWQTPLTNSTAAAGGSFAWPANLPLNTTSQLKVRVTDADAVPAANGTDTALASDSSNGNNTIYATLTLLANNGGVTWTSGTASEITWTVDPVGANVLTGVKIFYSVDNFLTAPVEIDTGVSKPSNNNPGNGTGKYTWTPNLINSNVKLRIVDANDPAVSSGAVAPGASQNQDDSDAVFTVTGFAIIAPAGGETALVNGSFTITYTAGAGITNVDLQYSPKASPAEGDWITMSGAGNLGVCGTPSAGCSFNWTATDAISTTAKVRARKAADSSVSKVSSNFNIKGAIAVTTPPGLKVGDAHNIEYTITGSLPDVIIEYSAKGDFSDTNEVTTITGLVNAQTPTVRTVAWPSGAANVVGTATKYVGATAKLRGRAINTGDPAKYPNGSLATSSDSGAFVLGAKFTITSPLSPDGTTTWYVNETNKNITWSVLGSVTNVKIEYVSDHNNDTVYDGLTTITASTTNDLSEPWVGNKIPDILVARIGNPNTTADRDIPVKIRISDADVGHDAAATDSAVFNVKYYAVTWQVKDNTTGSLLDALSVGEQDGGGAATWSVTNGSLSTISPALVRYYQYATYNTTWSKAGYSSYTLTSWTADSDKTNAVFVQDTTTVITPKFSYNYNSSTTTLSMTAWIDKQGLTETNGAYLGSASVTLFNGAAQIGSAITDPAADAKGVYDFSYNNSGGQLVVGSVYSATVSIVYNGQTKTANQSVVLPDTAQIPTISANLVTALANIATVNTAVGNVNTSVGNLNTALGTSADAAGANTVFGQVKGVAGALGAASDATTANTLFGKLNKMGDVTLIGEDVDAILDEVKNKLPAKISASGTGGSRGRLVAEGPTIIPTGGSGTLRYVASPGLTPKVDIYGPDNTLVVSGASFTVGTNKSFYSYVFNVPSTFKTGEYLAQVTEASTGALDTKVFNVVPASATQEKMASSIDSASSFALSASAEAKKVYEQMTQLRSTLGTAEGGGIGQQLVAMADNLSTMKRGIFLLTGGGEAGGEAPVTIQTVHDDVLGVLKQIQNVAGKKGINLDSVYQGVAAQGETTKEIQNMVAATQAAAESTREAIEKAQSKPVMTTWFEGR